MFTPKAGFPWQATVTGSCYPHGFSIRADGDFVGEEVWTLQHHGNQVRAKFTWNVGARKPLLRYVLFVLRSLFSANHAWAMKQGEEGLRRELTRLPKS